MIINPSAHTVVPRRNSFQNRTIGRHRRVSMVPVDKQFCFAVSKICFVSAVFLFLSSFWLQGSIEQVNAEIEQIQVSHSKLTGDNILLRAERAQLFSPKSVETLAENQLAIHLPGPEQYFKF
ncbi:MAG TPA: hypothetical protein EYP35_09305 [Desulfobacterales bacterium]|nr:hypothetical protein [Desulfobacterales bacterium]HIP40734.1 hypothetical protein [Desulfocapsa sulfexigens]